MHTLGRALQRSSLQRLLRQFGCECLLDVGLRGLISEERAEMVKKPKKTMAITSKLNVWFRHYINEKDPKTFLHNGNAAKAAGYRCSSEASFRNVGSQNYRKCADRIAAWLDENALSENALKEKLLFLMDAKERKFFSVPVKDDGKTEILIRSVEVPALETQRKTLDMALKVKGMNAPTVHEVAGKGGKKIGVEHSMDASWVELMSVVTCENTDRLPNAKTEPAIPEAGTSQKMLK